MNLAHTCLSVVLLISVLVGCGTISPSDSACMKTVLVSSLSRTPLYPLLEEDPRVATISIVKAVCVSSKEGESAGKAPIEIDLALNISEARKMSKRIKKALFPVFVALIDAEDNVLDRLDKKIEVTISDKPLNHSHKITYHPPQGIDVGSGDHRLLVGFHGSVMPSHGPLTHHLVKRGAHKKSVKQKIRSVKTTKE